MLEIKEEDIQVTIEPASVKVTTLIKCIDSADQPATDTSITAIEISNRLQASYETLSAELGVAIESIDEISILRLAQLAPPPSPLYPFSNCDTLVVEYNRLKCCDEMTSGCQQLQEQNKLYCSCE